MKHPLVRVLVATGWTLVFLVPLFFVTWFLVERVYEVPIDAETFRFKNEWAALLLPAGLLVLGARGWLQYDQAPRFKVSRASDIAAAGSGWRTWVQGSVIGLRISAITLVVIGLMRPQSVHAHNTATIQGLDIALALDMSDSMQEQDVYPNRFTATQHVVDAFIQQRPNDRIGAVIFGVDAFTLMPLTTDKDALRGVIRELELGVINGSGTAIGNALGVALNRLRRSTAVRECIEGLQADPDVDIDDNAALERVEAEEISERTCGVIILATDGSSNRGNISPDQAGHFARVMGIKIFSILMGADQQVALWGRQAAAPQQLNPELLQTLADMTGGTYFAVADRDELAGSFHEILNQLEQHDIEDRGKSYGELFGAFVWPSLGLLTLEIFLGVLVLRRWP